MMVSRQNLQFYNWLQNLCQFSIPHIQKFCPCQRWGKLKDQQHTSSLCILEDSIWPGPVSILQFTEPPSDGSSADSRPSSVLTNTSLMMMIIIFGWVFFYISSWLIKLRFCKLWLYTQLTNTSADSQNYTNMNHDYHSTLKRVLCLYLGSCWPVLTLWHIMLNFNSISYTQYLTWANICRQQLTAL